MVAQEYEICYERVHGILMTQPVSECLIWLRDAAQYYNAEETNKKSKLLMID